MLLLEEAASSGVTKQASRVGAAVGSCGYDPGGMRELSEELCEVQCKWPDEALGLWWMAAWEGLMRGSWEAWLGLKALMDGEPGDPGWKTVGTNLRAPAPLPIPLPLPRPSCGGMKTAALGACMSHKQHVTTKVPQCSNCSGQ